MSTTSPFVVTTAASPESERRARAKLAVKAYWAESLVTLLYGLLMIAVTAFVLIFGLWPEASWKVAAFVGGIILFLLVVAIDNLFVPSGGWRGFAIKVVMFTLAAVIVAAIIVNNAANPAGLLVWLLLVSLPFAGAWLVSAMWVRKLRKS